MENNCFWSKQKGLMLMAPFGCIVSVVGAGSNIATSCIPKFNNPTTRL